jgi:hypothetical protein
MGNVEQVPPNSPPARPLRPPMWVRWVLSLGTGAGLLVALVLFVNHHNSDSLAVQNPAALARANREADIVVAQDQAPRVVSLTSASAPRGAITRTVQSEMTRLIARGTVTGPLERTSCRKAGGRGSRLGFSCVATAAEVNYDFVGVVNVAARQLTYCKRDAPPVPSQDIPVSRRCRA